MGASQMFWACCEILFNKVLQATIYKREHAPDCASQLMSIVPSVLYSKYILLFSLVMECFKMDLYCYESLGLEKQQTGVE